MVNFRLSNWACKACATDRQQIGFQNGGSKTTFIFTFSDVRQIGRCGQQGIRWSTCSIGLSISFCARVYQSYFWIIWIYIVAPMAAVRLVQRSHRPWCLQHIGRSPTTSPPLSGPRPGLNSRLLDLVMHDLFFNICFFLFFILWKINHQQHFDDFDGY